MLLEKSLVRPFSPRGFTLIELLIVIAIILILIAIGLPNFLEAQLRAKVTKVSGELRTVTIALEDYQAQWRRYPPTAGLEPTKFGEPQAMRHSIMHLTTPTRYFQEVPLDILAPQGEGARTGWENPPEGPFGGMWFGPADFIEGYTFYYWSQESLCNTPLWEPLGEGYKANSLNYTIRSTGPDKDYDFHADPHPLSYRNGVGGWFYSPSNGTRSTGDLIRTRP
jgi:general secretion pathway protein G